MTTIAEQLQRVIEARQASSHTTATLRFEREAWEQLHSALLAGEKESREWCAAEEAKLRELALAQYAITGDKQVAPGVVIRVMPRLDYDAQRAYNWGLQHQLALTLDKKAFESIVKAQGVVSFSDLGFVTKRDEPTATIASDLEGAQIDQITVATPASDFIAKVQP